METIVISKPDTAFIRKVEEESGQVVSRCYQCGNCTAGCPMSFTYDYSASRLMRLIQAGQKETVLSSKALWMCASCETCTQRCPNNIDVAKILETCRHMARREGKGGVFAVKTFWDSFLTSVGLNGKVHEIGLMVLYMLRTGRFWTDVDLAPKALPKGKMSILPHRAEGRQEVADILRRFKEGAADEAVVRANLAARAGKGRDAAAALERRPVPGSFAAAAPSVNSPAGAASLPADASGAPAPGPSCGDSPTPAGWTGPAAGAKPDGAGKHTEEARS